MHKSVFFKSVALALIFILLFSFFITLNGCSPRDSFGDDDDIVDLTDNKENSETEEYIVEEEPLVEEIIEEEVPSEESEEKSKKKTDKQVSLFSF